MYVCVCMYISLIHVCNCVTTPVLPFSLSWGRCVSVCVCAACVRVRVSVVSCVLYINMEKSISMFLSAPPPRPSSPRPLLNSTTLTALVQGDGALCSLGSSGVYSLLSPHPPPPPPFSPPCALSLPSVPAPLHLSVNSSSSSASSSPDSHQEFFNAAIPLF